MPKFSKKKLKRILKIPDRASALWRLGYETKKVLDILEEEFPEYARRTLKNYIFDESRVESVKKQLAQKTTNTTNNRV